MINKHIKDYLDYYCDLAHAPDYAVLVKGAWGSGKTFFIKNYKEQLKKDGKKYLYVSLYGMVSCSEIEDQFFQQLHPLLSSKSMAITGKILKGALRATLKVDLDGDGKPDATVSSQIPDMNIPDYLKGTDECIIFFDDLERCNIEIETILGYINHFVEHQGLKIIVIANEEEVLRKYKGEESENSYLRVKEKLIGKTLCVVADVDDAIDDFIEKVDEPESKMFLQKNKTFVAAIYSISNYENLRNLKQAIWDFERIYKLLPEKAKAIDALVLEIMSFLLVFSFEIRKGSMLPADIVNLQPLYYANLFDDKKEKKDSNPLLKIIEKYSVLNVQEPLPSGAFWKAFFDNGVIEKSEMETSLEKSTFLKDEETPSWVRLYHFFELTDGEFEEVLLLVEQEFSDFTYEDIGIIKHIIGIWLWLSNNNLYKKSKSVIIDELKAYLEMLSKKGILTYSEATQELAVERDCYGGLGFFGNDLPEFNEACDCIERALNDAKIKNFPDEGNDLLEIMKSDFDKFSRMIRLSNSEDQIFYDQPILKYIQPKDFVDSYLSLEPKNQRKVGPVLEKRYQNGLARGKILEELDWLKELKTLFDSELTRRVGKPSGYVINATINKCLTNAIENIERDVANE